MEIVVREEAVAELGVGEGVPVFDCAGGSGGVGKGGSDGSADALLAEGVRSHAGGGWWLRTGWRSVIGMVEVL